jgi:hypothetical protein
LAAERSRRSDAFKPRAEGLARAPVPPNFANRKKYGRHAKDRFAEDWVAEATIPVHTAVASDLQDAGQGRATLPPTGWFGAARVRDRQTRASHARLIR